MSLPAANAIWVGPVLGPIHAACLASFVAAGHRTVLHCYEPPTNVPRGVDIVDARRLMPESQIVRWSKNGSYALFSDLYRLKILEAGLGLYVDCDVFCVRPIADKDYILGFESPKHLNGAVLKLPSDSKVLKDFLAAAADRSFVPPWHKKSRRWMLRFRKAIGVPVTIDRLPWGTLGPKALTYFASEAGILARCQPVDVFYPVPYDRVGLFFDPGLKLEDLITPQTLGLHLYHERLKDFLQNIPRASPLGEILRRADLPLQVPI